MLNFLTQTNTLMVIHVVCYACNCYVLGAVSSAREDYRIFPRDGHYWISMPQK